MKAANFYEMNNKELEAKLKELKENLFNLRFKHATNQLQNPLVMVDCKKDIARILTILKQRELGMVEEPVKKKSKAKAAKE